MRQRLRKKKVIVVIKALILFQLVIAFGNDNFITLLKKRRTMFELQKYHPIFVNTDNYLIRFAVKLGIYISQKVSVFNNLGYQFEKKRTNFNDLNIKTTLKTVAHIQNQLNALCNCMFRTALSSTDPTIQFSFDLLLKDGTMLYSILYDAIMVLKEHFMKAGSLNSKKILKIMKTFVNETKKFKTIFETFYKWSITRPEINFYKNYSTLFDKVTIIEDAITNMEKTIADREKESSEKKRNNKKSSKKRKGSKHKNSGKVKNKKKKVSGSEKEKNQDQNILNQVQNEPTSTNQTQIFSNNPFENGLLVTNSNCKYNPFL
jgi:hypothetical protein